MIIIGILLLVACGFYEAYWDMVLPLFPPVVLRKFRGVTCVLVGIFMFGMLYYSTAVLWPQQVQALYTSDLIKIGWYASSLGIAGIISSPIFGVLFTLGHARLLFIFIIVLGTVASGCMAIVCTSRSPFVSFPKALMSSQLPLQAPALLFWSPWKVSVSVAV
jgi:hypothetical protein